MGYREGELDELHTHLYEILRRTIEVCDRLGIEYVIIGGSAIGALFDGAILPWDDDIDLGMERDQYDRFLDEAQPLFGDDYFVQSPLSEPHTPYYFTKVRKSSTRFEGHEESGLDIHHGIAIDIFPLDRVPRSRFIERLQHRCVRLLTNSFVATTQPLPEGGLIQRALVHTFARVVDKRLIYRLLIWAQTLAKRHDTEFVSIVNMPRDHIRRSTLHPPQLMPFGGIEVKAPRDLRSYLEWHYPNLHRDVAPEEQINHAPHRLNFNGED